MKRRIGLISTHGYVAAEPPLGAPDTGGQVVFVLELARKLGLFGYQVDLWTRRFEEQSETEEIGENARIIRVPCGGDAFIEKEYLYLKLAEWFENARLYIKQHQLTYDFINSHYWDAGMAGMMLAKELDIPHIHTPHSIGSWKKEQMMADYPGSAEMMEKKYNFKGRIHNEKLVYHAADLVIATTHIQKDKLESSYELASDKIRVIPPGYDDNRFYPVGDATRDMIRRQLGFEKPTIVAISRLAANKGLDLLIDGFKSLHDRLSDTKLVLAVGHEDRSENENKLYEQLCRQRDDYGLQNEIDFIGYIEDEDLADYYRAADVFVMPSRYEPFGMTSVEAMACGTPTVITIHGGLFRILEHGIHTLFVDPFDKEDIGITLFKALTYPTLKRRMRQSGAQIARSRFTWTGIAQQLLNAAENLEHVSGTV